MVYLFFNTFILPIEIDFTNLTATIKDKIFFSEVAGVANLGYASGVGNIYQTYDNSGMNYIIEYKNGIMNLIDTYSQEQPQVKPNIAKTIDQGKSILNIYYEGSNIDESLIKLRISNDNGDTFYYYNTTNEAWEISTTEFNTLEEVNQNIGKLDISINRDIIIETKLLTDTEGTTTAVIDKLNIGII